MSLAFPKTLDNTIVSSWETCPAKAFLAHFLHLSPRGPRVHLDAGAVYASGLEAYRKAYYSETSPMHMDFEASRAHGLKVMIKEWGYDETVDAVFSTSKKEFHRVCELYVKYFNKFGHKTDEVVPVMFAGEPAVEKSFTLELDIKHPDTGDPILYHGRFDMLAEYNGGIFVFDDKTCSQLGATWGQQWDFRSQFTGYVFGAKTFGLTILGAIVRGACFYTDRVDYMQSMTRRHQWELDKWWEDLHVAVHNMVEYYKFLKEKEANGQPNAHAIGLLPIVPQRGVFSGACNAYSGCEFQMLCKAQRPERWIGEYQIRIWDPTNPKQEEV